MWPCRRPKAIAQICLTRGIGFQPVMFVEQRQVVSLPHGTFPTADRLRSVSETASQTCRLIVRHAGQHAEREPTGWRDPPHTLVSVAYGELTRDFRCAHSPGRDTTFRI